MKVMAAVVLWLAPVIALAVPEATMLRNAALVVTMDPSLGEGPLGLLENAHVLFEGGRIVSVGREIPVAEGRSHVTVVDAAGKIVLPGFVDVHNHLWQSLIRGCGVSRDLLGWLGECVFSLGGDLMTEEDAYAGVRLSLLDVIATGVTTVVDDSHSFNPAFVKGNLRALEESGIRFVYAYCGTAGAADEIRRVKKERLDPNPLATLQVCSHPAPALKKDLGAMAKLAKELGVGFNVHLLENIQQRKDEPMRMLREAGALGPGLLVNHAVHATPSEIAALARAGARVAHNPLSNMRLASGFAPVPRMHDAHLRVGLGLDGGTNDTSDVFAGMKAAVGIQRGLARRPDVYPTPADALRLATMGGAEVLGREKEIGSLTPGKRADIILVDPAAPNFAPRWAWIDQLVLNGQPGNVEAVWVEGRRLKKDGVVTVFPRAESLAAAEAAVTRIKAKLAARKGRG